MDDKLVALSARVDELETRLAFQEDTLSQLNDVIARQDANIRALMTALRDLGDKYKDLSFEVQGGSKGGQEKPPHY